MRVPATIELATFLWLLVTTISQGCAGIGTLSLFAPTPHEYIEKAERAENEGQFQEAAGYYELLLSKYPSTSDADRAELGAGKAYYRIGRYEEAYSHLSRLAERHPGRDLLVEAAFYQGLCLFRLERYGESLDVFHSLHAGFLDTEMRTGVFFYLGENYAKLNNVLSALHWYERCADVSENDETRRRIQERIKALVESTDDPNTLAEIISVFADNGFIVDVARLQQARLYYKRGLVRHAEVLVDELAVSHTDDILTSDIKDISSTIMKQATTNICTIGCVLPLSGEYECYGKDVLNALLLGAGAFEESGKERIRLLIRDSRGDAKEGMRCVEDLARNNELVGVIGPLLATVATSSAVAAQELKVPMITLTQKVEVADVGEYIFQNSMTPQQQVETVVKCAMEDLGLSRFAVLYPQDSYGQHYRDTFLRLVNELGGEVVSVVSYGKEETDFQEEVRQLVGELYWRKFQDTAQKGDPREDVDTLHLEPVEKEILERSPPKKDVLRPPFEALFIPDEYRKVAIIAPHLALYDLTTITLLGTSSWNTPKLVEMAGQYVQHAVFVDGFFDKSSDEFVRSFVDRYSKAFRKSPGVLEAQGYDSLMILENAFYRVSQKTREGIRAEIARLEDFQGLSGYTRFDEKGRAQKQLYVLSVINDNIVQLR